MGPAAGDPHNPDSSHHTITWTSIPAMAQTGFWNARQDGGEVGLRISKNGELTGRVEETSEAPTDDQAIYTHPLLDTC